MKEIDARRLTRQLFAGLLPVALSVPGTSAVAAMPPDIKLRLTVRQRESSKLDQGLHYMTLECRRGRCTLVTVSLNQCSPSPTGKLSFPPVVEVATTGDGKLKVVEEGDVLVLQEAGSDIGGDYVTTMRFTYDRSNRWPLASPVTAFSGGFVKNSALAKRVLTVDFVPLDGLIAELPLDCPVRLPGVDKP